MVNTYREKRIGDLPPHLYAIGAQSYQNIKLDSQGQCIIISGESGAGKTESTKLLVNFLANLNERSSLCEQIISANPILEAFGNAKTTKNDNSSRFGKYVEIYFDNCGKVEGACINHYLLEKARIKSQNIGERNYHIFYTMLEGLSQQEKAQLKLSTTCHYHYLKNGSVITCEGRDETQEFEQVKSGLKTLNFSQKDILEIFKLLSAILHLGNLTYNSITADNMEASEVVQCEHLDVILNLLQVVKKDFLEALTQKTMFIGGNKVVSHVSKDQACVNRDGFSMTLYSHVFSFILKQINKIISNQITSRKPSIGILDIFGFENFASNSFEQLCINFANEHLQQFFVEHIFKLEQEEYLKEGIKWQNLEFRDNEEVLVLLGGGQINVMTLIDDETKFPKGDDKGLMVRTHQHFVQHKSFLPSKSEAKLEFGIRHYAGLVRYRVDGFIEKNRNSLSADWLNVVKTCGNEFLKSLFTKELSSTAKGSKTSLIMQYKLSLEMLMATLHSCNPFFIRCIKPNNIKKASVFNHILCCQQLQYLGIMDTAKIRRAGYPIRYSYFEFIQRYRILVPGTPPAHKIQNSKGAAKKICQSVLHVESGDFQFGITKIFLKLHHCNILESEREKLFTKSAIILQRYFRAFLRKKRMEKMLNAAKVIQRYWRAYKPRRDYIVIQRGYLRLQASIRSRQVTHKFKKLKNIIIRLQVG
ncbi:hypothetical protein AAG570_001045 [Ranatra chinensis]|uniref:Myosin motor domain-containing protein n=1 Tax=Ranatra chinensis TaxID=642074 RepID=A0ABD0YAY9_9HEMI